MLQLSIKFPGIFSEVMLKKTRAGSLQLMILRLFQIIFHPSTLLFTSLRDEESSVKLWKTPNVNRSRVEAANQIIPQFYFSVRSCNTDHEIECSSSYCSVQWRGEEKPSTKTMERFFTTFVKARGWNDREISSREGVFKRLSTPMIVDCAAAVVEGVREVDWRR